MIRKITILFIGLLTLTLIKAQEPTKWRGPESNGIYNETGLLKQWTAEGPQMVWNIGELGQGHSSPVFANGKIYVSGMIENTGYIFVLGEDGKLLNKYVYGEEFTESWPGTRSTPTIDGDKLYILSGLGKLVCMDANSGKTIWSKDVFKDFDGKNIRWGITETILISGDKLFCSPGGEVNNIVALNKLTGDLIWSCPGKGDVSAYCSPILIKFPTRDLFVTMMANNVLGIDAKTGKLLWSYPQTNTWSVHANTPIYSDGGLYFFSGYGAGGVKLKLDADGSHGIKEWFNPSMDNRIGGAVLINGYVYGCGDNNKQWFCIDWKTGENKYQATDIGKGVVIADDGMLYCYSEQGDLALVEANPAGFKITGRMKITLGSDQHWAHPVIHDGKLYVRHGNTLMAYKIK